MENRSQGDLADRELIIVSWRIALRIPVIRWTFLLALPCKLSLDRVLDRMKPPIFQRASPYFSLVLKKKNLTNCCL